MNNEIMSQKMQAVYWYCKRQGCELDDMLDACPYIPSRAEKGPDTHNQYAYQLGIETPEGAGILVENWMAEYEESKLPNNNEKMTAAYWYCKHYNMPVLLQNIPVPTEEYNYKNQYYTELEQGDAYKIIESWILGQHDSKMVKLAQELGMAGLTRHAYEQMLISYYPLANNLLLGRVTLVAVTEAVIVACWMEGRHFKRADEELIRHKLSRVLDGGTWGFSDE